MSRFQQFRQLPSPRTLVLAYCLVSIILDLYLKYNPHRPWTHLLVGTSPMLELIVIVGVLLDNYRLAYWTCLLDVALGVVCLLTLPVINTAENLTGERLDLPFVAVFSADLHFVQISSHRELLYFHIFLGFFSTFLILVFLTLDALKLMILAKYRREQLKEEEKNAQRVDLVNF